jgi:8-oxo-dGTP pyrophosphatase MutT (NUDIX family)
MTEMIEEKSCGIIPFQVVDDDFLFLVLKYKAGHFEFPKGHVEEGESEVETAKREMHEETGISEVLLIEGFREEIHYTFVFDHQPISKTVVFFCGQVGEMSVFLSHEHLEAHWLKYNEARKMLSFETAKRLLDKAMIFLRKQF